MNVPDYIVVGAGSAGCVLANRLVEAGEEVLLLEAGPKNHSWDYRIHMPAGLSDVLAGDAYNWYYTTEPERWMNHRLMYCPRGRTLGGSSSINGMIYVRGNPEDFNRWARRTGYPEWDYQSCLPWFMKAECATAGTDDCRGRKGPLHVTRGELRNPLFGAFLEAGVEAGYPANSDLNGPVQEGFGAFDRTIYRGRRWSTAEAYLRPVADSPKLTVITQATITQINVANGVAESVSYLHRGSSVKVRANKEIILCAGAIDSPRLLMLSGIGDADHLKSHGIPVAKHLPGVGKGLQDHLEVYIQYACKKPVSLYPAFKWYNRIRIGLQWYMFKSGPCATNHFEAGAFIRSDESVEYPDLQLHFLPVAMNYDGSSVVEGHGFQIHIGPMKPLSRGEVRLRSNDPLVPASIRFNYNSAEEDRAVMRRAVRLARHIVSRPAFDEFRGHEISPGPQFETDEEVDGFVRANAESAYHPSCTCRMGSDDDCVVDRKARVYGVEGLRVIDASIMPEITNGNLNAPVIMMAEKLAAAIIDETD